ncbi:hypothetical protein BKA58DRAFT_207944 [Alternaria rosae]|uniref:uncharacterized protein n=1 Tax=Alternaria rosae TaxID=1187941 RepID=UPI001E8DC4DF|nr:uncharacterized protein BKA58DRAFT_207944 [Alternaria rosae]KAH6866612.1 hypothetical protein BKA58DRAFT_207944 [Alternaria rosae]
MRLLVLVLVQVVKVESGFFCSGIPPARLLISPGACCWDACPGQVCAWAALSFALFAPAFLPTLPCCCSPPAPALRAPRRRGHIRPSPASRRHSKTLTLACSPPRGPRDTDVQFAHLEYRSPRSDACRAASCCGKHASCVSLACWPGREPEPTSSGHRHVPVVPPPQLPALQRRNSNHHLEGRRPPSSHGRQNDISDSGQPSSGAPMTFPFCRIRPLSSTRCAAASHSLMRM